MKHLTVFLFVLVMLSSTAIMADNQPATNTKNSTFFIENKGQWPDEVLYMTSISGMRAWITKEGVVYDHFVIEREDEAFSQTKTDNADMHQRSASAATVRGHIINMKMQGINDLVMAVGLNQNPAYFNYFIGNKPENWASHVPLFEAIDLKEVYEGIDIKYYYDDGFLRYDYYVKPKADLSQIQFILDGQYGWHINQAGELIIETSIGEVSHGKLYAYQEENGIKNEIGCSFMQLKDGTLGIHTENYDPEKILVIDPLVFSTYLGGSDYEINPSLALDENDMIVVAAQTYSTDFPTTPGAYQEDSPNSLSNIISKLSSDGTALMFSTFFGGTPTSECESPIVEIGMNNNIYIAGVTYSDDFPVTSDAFQTENPGNLSCFISCLSSDGSTLHYSTYLGGEFVDCLSAFYIDNEGCAYVSGETYSNDFPVTPGALNNTTRPDFLTKINPDGTNLEYSAILTSGTISDITVNNEGIVYLIGTADNGDFTATPGAFQSLGNPSCFSAFIMVVNQAATEILYATYLSGEECDTGRIISLNEEGDIILSGNTSSTSFPTTPGAYQTINYDNAAYVVKMDATCSQMIWGTLIGGEGTEGIYEVTLDDSENVIICGITEGGGFPITTQLFEHEYISGLTGFVSLISADGSDLLFSSLLLNAYGESRCEDVDVNSEGNFIVTGTTYEGFPTTPDAYQSDFGGGILDSYIASILPVNCQTQCETTILNNVLCAGGSDAQAEVVASGGTEPYTYLWEDGQTTAIATGLNVGDYSVQITDAIGCYAIGNVSITEPQAIEMDTLQTTVASCASSNDGSATAEVSGGVPPYNFLWESGETGSQANNLLPGEQTLIITDNNACELVVEFNIDFIPPYDSAVICAVGVNPETSKNTILWQKTEGERIVAYNIYREGSASGIYELAGSRLFDETPEFEDIEANPAQQSYRYKIAVVDSCQEESPMSDFHKTIHLSMNTGVNNEVNLLWTAYEGFTYPTHYILRSINDGPFAQIGLVPSSNLSFTDLTPPSGTKKYMIEIEAPADCNTTKSNTRIQSNTVVLIPTSMDENTNQQLFRVYPNPADKRLEIETAGFKGLLTISMLNVEGQKVLEQQISSNKTILYLENITAGVYVLLLKNNGLLIESEKIVIR